MDVSDPAAGLSAGLTMPVLRVLARRSSPATAAQVHKLTGSGTEAGVRRAVDRLARHGIVRDEQVGDRTVYSLNYDHVLHAAVVALLRAEDELPRRLRKALAEWQLQPAAAALYGSAARRDGGIDSDIDLLLVRPRLARAQQRELWAQQVHRLRGDVERWTGNRCQVTDRSQLAIDKLVRAREPIVAEWRDHAVHLAGIPLDQLLGSA